MEDAMSSMQRPKIVQLVPFNQTTAQGEPTGFFGLDAMGGIWRTTVQGSGEQRSVHWIRVQEQ
jgi:hypothetical protein